MKIEFDPQINHIYLIGAGGIGGQLLSTLLLTLAQAKDPPSVTIIDGDTVEERNLDRQLFETKHIGVNKAVALADCNKENYSGLITVPDYFYDGFEVKERAVFFCCVDNHPARRAILNTIDRTQGFGIFGGNEYTDEEAFVYHYEWQGGPLDPRVYYPSILTDHTGDPMIAMAGCTGEAQAAAPQLAIANKGAAFYMLKLFWFYFVELAKLDRETMPIWPIRFSSNFSRCSTAQRAEFNKPAVG